MRAQDRQCGAGRGQDLALLVVMLVWLLTGMLGGGLGAWLGEIFGCAAWARAPTSSRLVGDGAIFGAWLNVAAGAHAGDVPRVRAGSLGPSLWSSSLGIARSSRAW